MKIENCIKDAIALTYNETPRVSVMELDPESTVINVNFEDSTFRIDKTFETNIPVRDRRKNGPKKRLTQIFIGIPARDIHYEDLKEIFTIIFKAYYGFKTQQKYAKLNAKSKQKNSNEKESNAKSNQESN